MTDLQKPQPRTTRINKLFSSLLLLLCTLFSISNTSASQGHTASLPPHIHCMANCHACTSPSDCQICDDGHFIVRHPVACVACKRDVRLAIVLPFAVYAIADSRWMATPAMTRTVLSAGPTTSAVNVLEASI